MRTFKCLAIALAHVVTHLTLFFFPHGNNETLDLNIGVLFGSLFGTLLFSGATISVNFKKRRKVCNRTVIVLFATLYCCSLTALLWSLRHFLSEHFADHVYSTSGNIGLIFLVLVVYENMQINTEELYDKVLQQMVDEEEGTAHEMNALRKMRDEA